MDKEYQKNNNTVEAANDNEVQKPEHVITAEFSIEVTGEDEPTKYDKRREFWGGVVAWSVVAFIVSIIVCCASPYLGISSIYGGIAIIISSTVFFISIWHTINIDPDEPTGSMPWWYGGL